MEPDQLQGRNLYSQDDSQFNCTTFNSKLQNLQACLTNIKTNLKKNEVDYLTGDFKERTNQFKELNKFESHVEPKEKNGVSNTEGKADDGEQLKTQPVETGEAEGARPAGDSQYSSNFP